jgi:hypothetical protein
LATVQLRLFIQLTPNLNSLNSHCSHFRCPSQPRPSKPIRRLHPSHDLLTIQWLANNLLTTPLLLW